jgi:CBS domain-containing protein
MESLAFILETKPKAIHTTIPDASVLDAVDEMCRAKVGALLVVRAEQPIGILSERDVLTRVVLRRRDPADTLVAEVMTRDVVCVDVSQSPEQAMAIMTERRCRHLPVVRGSSLVGMISIGDLVRWVSRAQEAQIRMLDEYVGGAYPPPASSLTPH